MSTSLGIRKMLEYLVKNLRIGGRTFGLHQSGGPYWMLGLTLIFSTAIVAVLVNMFAVPALVDRFALGASIPTTAPEDTAPSSTQLTELIGVLFMYVWYIFILGYARGKFTRLFYDDLTFGNHSFASQLSPLKLAWIYLSNAMGIILTLGLAIPWANLRSYRYRMSTLEIQALGPLMEGVNLDPSANSDPSDAIGDALVDLGGFDFGI